MQKTVTYCDVCGKPDSSQFMFAVDSELDGNGGSNTIHEEVDLCGTCCATQLQNFILALPWAARQKFAERTVKDRKFYLDHMSITQRTHGL